MVNICDTLFVFVSIIYFRSEYRLTNNLNISYIHNYHLYTIIVGNETQICFLHVG